MPFQFSLSDFVFHGRSIDCNIVKIGPRETRHEVNYKIL